MATNFSLSRIGQIAVNVHDLKKATAFYRDALGMKFLFETPTMAFFECGDVRLMLGVAEKPEFDHPASIIYYTVDDIQQSFEVLSSRGVHFEDKPHVVGKLQNTDVWMTFFRDIDSNLLALTSEVQRT